MRAFHTPEWEENGRYERIGINNIRATIKIFSFSSKQRLKIQAKPYKLETLSPKIPEDKPKCLTPPKRTGTSEFEVIGLRMGPIWVSLKMKGSSVVVSALRESKRRLCPTQTKLAN